QFSGMPLQKRTRLLARGPSLVIKRIQDDDTFQDFCNQNNGGQREKKISKYRTDAIWREDPLAIRDFEVPYSMEKKRRWELPGIIEEQIEELQDPSLNLRVSASIHTCSRLNRPRITSYWPWGFRASGPEDHPTISYHNVTRSGEVQHKRSKKADLRTLEFAPQENSRPSHPKKRLPKEENQLFQKLHIRYTVFSMTERPSRFRMGGLATRTHQRPPPLSVDDCSEMDCCPCCEHDYWDFCNDDVSLDSPSTMTLADYVTEKREKRRRTKRTKRGGFCDEEISARFVALLKEEEEEMEDFELVPEPVKLALNEKFASNEAENVQQCLVCCEMREVLVL
ncbi:hypothetical protein PMAYCL1PPCAC_01298, partial [Pristionchus mayeri]